MHRHGRAVALAAAGWGLAIVGFGFADALWLALLCLAVAGGMDAISGLFRSVIWNETIPDRLRGRLAGVEMISYTSGPTLGNFEAGALAALTSVRTSIVSGGVMCVAGTGWCWPCCRRSGATTRAMGCRPDGYGDAGAGTKLRLRSPWKAPSGSATGAPAPETRGALTPAAAALALRPFALRALPARVTLSVDVLALPPAGVNVTLST